MLLPDGRLMDDDKEIHPAPTFRKFMADWLEYATIANEQPRSAEEIREQYDLIYPPDLLATYSGLNDIEGEA